jgi:hypothetical protein
LCALAWRGTAEGVVIWFAFVALALGCSAGPLIVFPEYLGGAQGATVVLSLVLPAAAIGELIEQHAAGDRRTVGLTRKVLAGYVVVLLAAVTTAAAFTAVQGWRYRGLQRATIASDPVAALKDQQFRYAHLFNDLPVGRQGRLVAELQASADPSVARWRDEPLGDFDRFRPEVIVRTATQVHLIAWMGAGFTPPVPRLFQGSTHSSLFICGRCPLTSTVNDVERDVESTMINDLEWQGRYRMFSVPKSLLMGTAPFFRVAAERAVALDTRLPSYMVTQMIGGARLAF